MISFGLRCDAGHTFDGWFRGNDDFDKQRERGLLACPICGSTSVSKALMAPNVSTGRSKEKAATEFRNAMVAAHETVKGEVSRTPVDGDVLPAEKATQPVASVPSLKDAPAPVKAYIDAVRTLRAEVVANSEDVGGQFAEEARKMHHGETEERAIRGQATMEEAVALDDEGIDVFVLPTLPEDGH